MVYALDNSFFLDNYFSICLFYDFFDVGFVYSLFIYIYIDIKQKHTTFYMNLKNSIVKEVTWNKLVNISFFIW